MKNTNPVLSAFIITFIFFFATSVSAQFNDFSGSWRSFNKETHMEKLTDDDQGVVIKYTETLTNGVSDNGKKLIIGFAKTDEQGQIIRRTYELAINMDGNISGSDEMNRVKFNGIIKESNNEQVIILKGNFVDGSNELFGLEFYLQNTETGKILQMKEELSITGDNLVDQYNGNNYNGLTLETRPADGENQFLTYWQVMNFKPEN